MPGFPGMHSNELLAGLPAHALAPMIDALELVPLRLAMCSSSPAWPCAPPTFPARPWCRCTM